MDRAVANALHESVDDFSDAGRVPETVARNVDRERARRHSERARAASRPQTPNDSPHPQVRAAFGIDVELEPALLDDGVVLSGLVLEAHRVRHPRASSAENRDPHPVARTELLLLHHLSKAFGGETGEYKRRAARPRRGVVLMSVGFRHVHSLPRW